MNIKCEGYLIKNTGITTGNYMYWESKTACDSWFQSKKVSSFSAYSVVRPESNSKFGFSVASIHVDMPYNETTECDYASIKNDNYNRWIHCCVINREYVNEKSTRLYLSIDYIASYWDTIEIKESFIERTHVNDDWAGVLFDQTASKYLLPEPVIVTCRHRPELLLKNPLEDVNYWLTPEESEYCLVSAVSEDGEVNNPKMNFQSGSCLFGYSYSGDKARIEELASKYITYMSKMINKSNSFAENIESIYFAPIEVLETNTEEPIIKEITFPLESIVNKALLPVIKHAKTMDCFRLRVVANNGAVLMTHAEYGHYFQCSALFTGSSTGRCTILMKDKLSVYNGISIESNTWPAVGVAGALEKYNFQLNNQIVKEQPTMHGAKPSQFIGANW